MIGHSTRKPPKGANTETDTSCQKTGATVDSHLTGFSLNWSIGAAKRQFLLRFSLKWSIGREAANFFTGFSLNQFDPTNSEMYVKRTFGPLKRDSSRR